MERYVNFMLSEESIAIVKSLLRKLKFKFKHVTKGKIEFREALNDEQEAILSCELLKKGFSLVALSRNIMVDQICFLVKNMFVEGNTKPDLSYSLYIAKQLKSTARIVGKTFNLEKKQTLQRYIIDFKIDLAIVLLKNKENLIKGIAMRLHYCDVPHFIKQFKKETGQNPGHFIY